MEQVLAALIDENVQYSVVEPRDDNCSIIIKSPSWESLVLKKQKRKTAAESKDLVHHRHQLELTEAEQQTAYGRFVSSTEDGIDNIDLDEIVLQVVNERSEVLEKEYEARVTQVQDGMSEVALPFNIQFSENHHHHIVLSLLEIAAYFNEVEIVEILMPHYGSNDDVSYVLKAFYTACSTASSLTVSYFLQQSDVIWEYEYQARAHALCVAAKSNHVDIMELLLESDSDFIFHTVALPTTASSSLLEYPAHAPLLQYPELAIELAIKSDAVKAVEFLLEFLTLEQKERALQVAFVYSKLSVIILLLRHDNDASKNLMRSFNLYPRQIPGREEKSPWLEGRLTLSEITNIKTQVRFDFYLIDF